MSDKLEDNINNTNSDAVDPVEISITAEVQSENSSDALGRKALKSGIWYTIGNFVSKGAVFLTMPFFTRLMTKNDVGLFSNFTSWISILCVITTFDLFSSISLAKYDYKDNIDDYISSNLIFGSLITAMFYVVCLCCKSYILEFLSFSELEFHIVFVYFMVYPAMQMFQVRSRIYYKYKISVVISLSSALLSTGISLLLVYVMKDKYLGRYLGYIGPLIVINCLLYIYFLIRGHKLQFKYCKHALAISFPLIWHTLSGTLLSSSDRVMITNMIGADANALYSVAYTCSAVVSLLWTSMNTAWSPWAYDQMEANNYAALKKASRPYIIFFGVIVVGFLLIAPELLWIMGGSDYLSALNVIPPVMIACVFQFVYSLYVNIEFYYKKQVLTAMGTLFAAAINILLNFLFIPKFGYIAAAYTTLVGYIVLFFVHFIISIILKKSFFYDTKFNLLFLLCALLFMIGMIYLYLVAIARYIIIGLLVVGFIAAMIFLRKEIKYLIKERSFDAFKQKFKRKKVE